MSTEDQLSNDNTPLTREDITQNPNIKLYDTDTDENLDLFCYTNCDENSDELVKKCRGIVLSGEKVVLNAFNYNPDYTVENEKKIEEVIDFTKHVFFDSQEGALLRLFYHNGKWFVSTHHRLNAFRSKWSSRYSFGSMFKDAIEYEYRRDNSDLSKMLKNDDNIYNDFLELLNKEYSYTFLVRNNNENRIVCNAPYYPTLYHVGTFIDNKLVFTENVGFPYPRQHNFQNIDQLLDHVEDSDFLEKQGIIVFSDSDCVCKILTRNYQRFFNVRGNESSVKYRYLQIRNDQESAEMLSYLYPKLSDTFDEYEECLLEITKDIHQSYIRRYIKKEYVTLPREEFQIMKLCHEWYLEDRNHNRISFRKVTEVMNGTHASALNKMIRRVTSNHKIVPFRDDNNSKKRLIPTNTSENTN